MKVKLSTGIEMFYEQSGDREPLILIPGTGCDHQIWDIQKSEWEKHFKVITIDNRGSGQSTIPTDVSSYTVEVMADDVAALMDALDISSAHLAGHSVGASIVQQVAIRHPDRVKSLQLHATFGRADEWLKSAFIATMKYPLLKDDPHFCFKTCMMWSASPTYLETRKPVQAREMVTKCLIKNPHLNAGEGILGHLNADEKYNAVEQLKEISVPTLVTAGEIDMLVPKRYSLEVLAQISGAQYHEFKGDYSSHFAFWEMHEEFTEIGLNFLLNLKENQKQLR